MAVLASPLLALKSITTAWVSVVKLLELLAARNASKLGLRTVSVTAMAAKDDGRLQLVAEPPCVAKLARFAATGKALPPIKGALYGGAVPLRVSRMRQGTTGVYTRSSPVSPSDLVCISAGDTAASVCTSAPATTLRKPSMLPARLAARRWSARSPDRSSRNCAELIPAFVIARRSPHSPTIRSITVDRF